METKFNFKSQIATSREQSDRLLALGLKKETADCMHNHCWTSEDGIVDDIPAWSLHRMWELYWSNKVVYDCLFGCRKNENPYEVMIAFIERDIEDGTFNKDYLDK